MGRIVIQHLILHPFVLPIVDCRKHKGRPLVEFIDSHVARKRLQCPVQKRTAHLALRLFSPQPPPSSGWWHRAQTRGGRATGASWWGGRASHLPPPGGRPSGSPAACNDLRVGPHRTDRYCNAYGMASSSEKSKSPEGQRDDRCIHRQGRVTCVGRMCGESRDGHIGDRGCTCGSGRTPQVSALGGP